MFDRLASRFARQKRLGANTFRWRDQNIVTGAGSRCCKHDAYCETGRKELVAQRDHLFFRRAIILRRTAAIVMRDLAAADEVPLAGLDSLTADAAAGAKRVFHSWVAFRISRSSLMNSSSRFVIVPKCGLCGFFAPA